jgi:2-polyprenyl-3-methyl-5-hydroxy-6-metoxy-1,4-benzoquinol methylase
MKSDQPCDICFAHDNEIYYQIKKYNILKCKNCSHFQVNPLPTIKNLNELYKKKDAGFYENSFQVNMKKNKDFLLNYYSDRLDLVSKTIQLNKKSNILDFGCSEGNYVKALIYSGYKKTFGYDIAIDPKEKRLFSENLNSFKRRFNKKFDAIISYHTFEHLRSPSKTLKKLSSCIKRNGYLCINVPHIKSLQAIILKHKSPIIAPPYHLHYFVKSSLIRLLENNNFKIIKIKTPFWEKSTDIYLEKVVFKNKVIPIVLRYLVSPIRYFIEKFGLGGNLLIIAKKIR